MPSSVRMKRGAPERGAGTVIHERGVDTSTIAGQPSRAQTKWRTAVGVGNSRRQMSVLMLLADVTGFAAAAAMLLLASELLKFFVFDAEDLKYLVVPVFCLVLFVNSKLYPGVGINPAEEIKLVTQYVTTGFVGGWILILLFQARWIPNQLAFPILWALSLLSILLMRWSVRIQAVKLGLWGEPVVVMGAREAVDRTVGYFLERRRLGFVPVTAVLDPEGDQTLNLQIPIVARSTLLTSHADRFSKRGIRTALVDVPDISGFFRSDEAKALFRLFHRVILVSDLDWLDGASMRIQDFEGVIGIAAEKSVLRPTDAFMKRTLDITLAIIIGVALLPVLVAVAMWIKLDSPGPIFYDQPRLAKDRRSIKRPGEHWRKIRFYKFRTMLTNSDGALKAYLLSHPKAQQEWDANQKLQDDPRTTRAGRFLRKFSIDEFPQLLNVIKGEMSLVGPRPMMESQLRLYGTNIEAYTGVRPGMTGLWQVSGRNRTTFEKRVRLDVYYIRNWSVWLDIYILLRTAWVVFSREGAY